MAKKDLSLQRFKFWEVLAYHRKLDTCIIHPRLGIFFPDFMLPRASI